MNLSRLIGSRAVSENEIARLVIEEDELIGIPPFHFAVGRIN